MIEAAGSLATVEIFASSTYLLCSDGKRRIQKLKNLELRNNRWREVRHVRRTARSRSRIRKHEVAEMSVNKIEAVLEKTRP